MLRKNFEVTPNPLIISQNVKKLIKSIDNTQIKEPLVDAAKSKIIISKKEDIVTSPKILTDLKITSNIRPQQNQNENLFTKFSNLIISKKLKDEELILLHYIIERSRFTLMTGWQEHSEIQNIKEWEEIHDVSPLLSSNYPSILNRFQIRGFIEVSEVTSYGNPKEFKIKDEIAQHLLDLNESLLNEINECLKRNYHEHMIQAPNNDEDVDDLPF